MTPERFRQVDRLITLVLSQQESERKAFLERACEGDAELRCAVESLLTCDEDAGSFLARPATQLLAEELADESKPFAATAPTTAVGRYLVERELGSGGMGLVYAGYDPELGRKVAIKLMRPEASGKADPSQGRARLLREAQALAQLTHPNVIAIHDVGTFGDQVFIAMEYVEGCTLTDWLLAQKRSWSEIVSIFVQAGSGLGAAHAKGIVHRDFKPDNLWVGEDGRAQVLDFGLARPISTQPAEPPGEENKLSPRLAMLRASITETGKLLGTPAYMAPEQRRGEVGDARSDQFSFCVALYQALYGEFPFRAESVEAPRHQVKQRTLKEMPKPRGVPSWLRRVLLRGLTANPADRYPSMDRLLQELAHRPFVARHRILVPGAVVLLALSLVLGIGWKKRSTAPGRIQSIVVLPLENVSPARNEAQDFWVDGITDALTTGLAQIRALRVISRTSAMQYKGAKKSLSQIARELNVEAVVQGTVAGVGERVRVSAQLIDARTDQHLWAASYERDLRDILALQGEVARAIADQIKIQMTPQERMRLATRRQVNPEAYEAYLRGRYFLTRRTEDGFQKAIHYFNRAIEKDPNNAPAHAGLADSYLLMGTFTLLPSSQAHRRGREAAAKALELDEGLAEAHHSMAFAKDQYEWDWSGAEAEYKRALELDPGFALCHYLYAQFLSAQLRHKEALVEVRRAQQLDPLSFNVNAGVGTVLMEAGQEDLAVEQLRKLVELDPNFGYAHFQLGRTYVRKQAFVEAIDEFQKAATLGPNQGRLTAALGHAYGRAGKTQEAHRVLQELTEASQRGQYVSWTDRALVHSGLGDVDQTFALLEKALADREQRLVRIKVEPMLDPVRSDPRFAQLLSRIGLSR
jgi:serine/threonine protein kinase/Tfp pilus assembly protein PilF